MTLKDMDRIEDSLGNAVVDKGLLRQKVIEWIKEDICQFVATTPQASFLISKWIKRFNLTEADLK